MNPNYNNPAPPSEFLEKVIQIKRVSKKTKGGNQISFTALTVAGDRVSRVGIGHARAKNVADAIKKSLSKARKNMITLQLVNQTISGSVVYKYKGASVSLRPGKSGSGLIAGGPVRAVVEPAGIKDLVSKVHGTRNKMANVMATFNALCYLSALKS